MEMIVKEFEKNAVRMINENGDIWFVATDVAKVLGYKRPNDAVNLHCKGAVKRRILTDGGNQELNVIPESDVYRLIFRSKLPAAQKFEEWVTKEVLPSIRKNGAYMAPGVDLNGITASIAESLRASMMPALREIARLEHVNEFLSHFKPYGQPGDISATTGKPKNEYRRACYVSGRGKSLAVFMEHPELPGMFEKMNVIDNN